MSSGVLLKMAESRVLETHTFYKVRADFQSTPVPNWFTLQWRNTEDFNPTQLSAI